MLTSPLVTSLPFGRSATELRCLMPPHNETAATVVVVDAVAGPSNGAVFEFPAPPSVFTISYAFVCVCVCVRVV